MGILDPLHNHSLRSFPPLDPPVLKTPTVDGNPGTTQYDYCATFKTIVGETLASAVVSVTNGPNALDGFNRVRLEVSGVPAAAKKVRFFKKSGPAYCLLAEVDASIAAYWDQGQALQTTVHPPTVNTSGRDSWFALLARPGTDFQRSEVSDMQAMLLSAIGNIVESLHKDGDVIRGCAEQDQGGNVWKFTAGAIVLSPYHIPVPAGTVTITGIGTEKVGLLITPTTITDTDDPVLRDVDEGVDLQFAEAGAYRLGCTVQWVVDTPGMIEIKTFVDGVPLLVTQATERSELEIELARQRYDVSGNFMVRPFPIRMLDHATDLAKLYVEISPGKAYPMGFEVETKGALRLECLRAREYAADNNSGIDTYLSPGGAVIGTAAENFDVDGKSIKLQVGSGNDHTVTFSGNGKTAQQVADAINASINAYPTAGGLVQCAASGTLVKLQAANGKNLTVKTVANDAYTILGISTGTYTPTGQRIYPMNEKFVRDVTDLSFICEVVEAVTHDGTTNKDLLANENVVSILGASTTLADAHDGKWTYQYGVDFGRTGNYIDFTLYGGADPANGVMIYVKYNYRRNAVKTTKVRVRVTDAQITKGAEDGQDNIVFTGATSIVEAITGNPVSLSGNAPDVISILRVNNTPGQSQSQYDSYSLKKNATALAFGTSQIDWSAAGAQGVTPAGQPSSAAVYYVSFECWHIVTQGDYIACDSYVNDYEKIELSPDGVTHLRDCLDFRGATQVPIPGDAAVFDFNYYLSRADKVILDQYGNFSVIKGVAALAPVPPQNSEACIPLAVLSYAPYTYTKDEVKVIPLGFLRTPQIGLQELRERVERLEYWAAVNKRESAADEHSAAVSGKGMFVDPLTGQGRGDVAFSKRDKDGNLVEFTAAIDPREMCFRLPASEDAKTITLDEANSTGITRVGKVLMFDFEETPLIVQDKFSQTMNVNPDEVFSFIGDLDLDPEQDFYQDVERLPALTVENYDGNYDALLADAANANRSREINWGAWSLAWDNSGGFAAQQLQTDDRHWGEDSPWSNQGPNALRERTGTTTSLVPGRNTFDLGDSVKDITALPYMRTKNPDGSDFTINCSVTGLAPNIEVACTIDGVAVACVPTGTTVAGTHTYQGKATVMTNAAGSASWKFIMPAAILVGEKMVKVFDYLNPENSFAMSQFCSFGFRKTVQDTVMGFTTLTEKTEVVTEQEFHYADPLGETFAIESGVKYISSVSVRFASKDASLPVICEIRGTFNGYPTSKLYQTCTLQPNQVQVSADGSLKTKFRFQNIVGYTPGEYCIILRTNCTSYTVWIAELGKKDIPTGAIIAKQPYAGSLFHSPNNSTWVPETKMDLAFEIDTCNFQNNAQIVFHRITGIEASMLALAVTQFLPAGCNLNWSFSLDGTKWKPFNPGLDTELAAVTEQLDLLADITALGGTFQLVEPLGVILLLNRSAATYVGNNVKLADSLNLPNRMKMILDLATDGVNGSGVRSITPKWSPDDGEHWIDLALPAGFTPVDVGDGTYKQYEFETPGQASVSGATNASPIVITSAGHGFKNNQVADIAGIGGNTAANGKWRLKSVTADTMALYNPDTGAASVGNGAYTSGGTIDAAEFSQFRTRVDLATSSQAVTPKGRNVVGIGY